MLADPDLEAVIVATSDALACRGEPSSALEAGKACALREACWACRSKRSRRCATRWRAHRAHAAGRAYEAVRSGAGSGQEFHRYRDGRALLALKAWYCDSTHRYTMTDAVQPLPGHQRATQRKPSGNPKADLRRYYMLAHGSHLVDTARWLCGPDHRSSRPSLGAVRRLLLVRGDELRQRHARPSRSHGLPCGWIGTKGCSSTAQNGSVIAKTFKPLVLPVERRRNLPRGPMRPTRRPLGADGHFYRRQIEGFADTDPAWRAHARRRCRRWRRQHPRHGCHRAFGRNRYGRCGSTRFRGRCEHASASSQRPFPARTRRGRADGGTR